MHVQDWLILGLSFLASLFSFPIVRWVSSQTGKVVQPRKDRWHSTPTPTLGGLMILTGFCAGMLLISPALLAEIWVILLSMFLMFLLGLADDFLRLAALPKFLAQTLIALLPILSGYMIEFFPLGVLNIFLTLFWLVGIVNAINLLDNMDGIAAGISGIVALFLALFFGQTQSGSVFLPVTLALLGGIGGFWLVNSPPARIFMGDSGSLFLGFSLAMLAVVRTSSASNVLAVIAVPLVLFLLPILDTSLVTITRLLRGQSPAQGGTDHTTHRLVRFGLSERQVAFTLYILAGIAGGLSALIEWLDYDTSLVVFPLIIVALSLFAAYISRVQVVVKQSERQAVRNLQQVLMDLTYRRRMLEVILDILVLGVTFYSAIWMLGGYNLPVDRLDEALLQTSVAILVGLIVFWLSGLYRSIWELFSLRDVTSGLLAALLTSGITWLVLSIMSGMGQVPVSIFALFFGLLAVTLIGTRMSFRIIDQFIMPVSAKERGTEDRKQRIIIVSSGPEADLIIRGIKSGLFGNGNLEAVGVVAMQAEWYGRSIQGLPVISSIDLLPSLVERNKTEGLILSQAIGQDRFLMEAILKICRETRLWVKQLDIQLIAVDGLPYDQTSK